MILQRNKLLLLLFLFHINFSEREEYQNHHSSVIIFHDQYHLFHPSPCSTFPSLTISQRIFFLPSCLFRFGSPLFLSLSLSNLFGLLIFSSYSIISKKYRDKYRMECSLEYQFITIMATIFHNSSC